MATSKFKEFQDCRLTNLNKIIGGGWHITGSTFNEETGTLYLDWAHTDHDNVICGLHSSCKPESLQFS